jgi:acyl carrier protein
MTDIQTAIRKFIAREILFQKDESAVKVDDQLLERRMIDSAGMMELVTFLETEYAIQVNREDIIPDNFETIEKISMLVASKIKK